MLSRSRTVSPRQRPPRNSLFYKASKRAADNFEINVIWVMGLIKDILWSSYLPHAASASYRPSVCLGSAVQIILQTLVALV
jgi:hypothetical protein